MRCGHSDIGECPDCLFHRRYTELIAKRSKQLTQAIEHLQQDGSYLEQISKSALDILLTVERLRHQKLMKGT